jgi:hypothetical protein
MNLILIQQFKPYIDYSIQLFKPNIEYSYDFYINESGVTIMTKTIMKGYYEGTKRCAGEIKDNHICTNVLSYNKNYSNVFCWKCIFDYLKRNFGIERAKQHFTEIEYKSDLICSGKLQMDGVYFE